MKIKWLFVAPLGKHFMLLGIRTSRKKSWKYIFFAATTSSNTSAFPVGLLCEVFYRSTMAKLKPKGI